MNDDFDYMAAFPSLGPGAIAVLFLCLIAACLITSGTLMAATVTPTTVTLNWTAPGDDSLSGTAAVYDIRYYTMPITTSNWDQAISVDGEPSPNPAGFQESFTIENLTPGTTYYFAVKSADESGNWSPLSNVAVVATETTDTPPAAITGLYVNSGSSSTTQLIWAAPGEDSLTGTATAYDIRYATFPITTANWNLASQVSGEPSPQPAGSVESFLVTGLISSMNHYFAIKTVDASGQWSGLSNVVTYITGAEQNAPSDIADLTIAAIGANSVSLSWTAPGDDGISGTASAYDIRYAIYPITASNWATAWPVASPDPAAPGSVQTATISNLYQETRYYFAIKTADEVPNWSGLSNVISAVTLDTTAPAAITDLVAYSGDGDGELILTWTNTGDDGFSGTAISFQIIYADDTTAQATWDIVMNPPSPLPSGQQQTYTLTGLNPATMYWVAIQVFDNAGNSSVPSNIAGAESGFEFEADADDDDDLLPDDFLLEQNYPNPFNPQTTIGFNMPQRSQVKLIIYNVLGQEITTLIDRTLEAGTHHIIWNGTDQSGRPVASGMYAYRIVAEDFHAVRKMILMK